MADVVSSPELTAANTDPSLGPIQRQDSINNAIGGAQPLKPNIGPLVTPENAATDKANQVGDQLFKTGDWNLAARATGSASGALQVLSGIPKADADEVESIIKRRMSESIDKVQGTNPHDEQENDRLHQLTGQNADADKKRLSELTDQYSLTSVFNNLTEKDARGNFKNGIALTYFGANPAQLAQLRNVLGPDGAGSTLERDMAQQQEPWITQRFRSVLAGGTGLVANLENLGYYANTVGIGNFQDTAASVQKLQGWVRNIAPATTEGKNMFYEAFSKGDLTPALDWALGFGTQIALLGGVGRLSSLGESETAAAKASAEAFEGTPTGINALAAGRAAGQEIEQSMTEEAAIAQGTAAAEGAKAATLAKGTTGAMQAYFSSTAAGESLGKTDRSPIQRVIDAAVMGTVTAKLMGEGYGRMAGGEGQQEASKSIVEGLGKMAGEGRRMGADMTLLSQIGDFSNWATSSNPHPLTPEEAQTLTLKYLNDYSSNALAGSLGHGVSEIARYGEAKRTAATLLDGVERMANDVKNPEALVRYANTMITGMGHEDKAELPAQAVQTFYQDAAKVEQFEKDNKLEPGTVAALAKEGKDISIPLSRLTVKHGEMFKDLLAKDMVKLNGIDGEGAKAIAKQCYAIANKMEGDLRQAVSVYKSKGKLDFPDLPPMLQNARTEMLKRGIKPQAVNTAIAIHAAELTRYAAEEGKSVDEWLKENPFEVRAEKYADFQAKYEAVKLPKETMKRVKYETDGMSDKEKMAYFEKQNQEAFDNKGTPAYQDLKSYLRKNPIDLEDKGGLTGETKELRREWLPNATNPETGKLENLSVGKNSLIRKGGTSIDRLLNDKLIPEGYLPKDATPSDAVEFLQKVFTGGKHVYAEHHGREVNQSSQFYQSKQPSLIGKIMGEQPRAAITFEGTKAVIHLFEGADKSTFSHECFHLGIQRMKEWIGTGNASEGFKADYEAMKKWVGPEGLDKNGDFTPGYTGGHERLARAWEAYLMDGKAPARELVGVFSRMAQWLTDIYKHVKNLLGDDKITPELRAVFDRRLASQEQIEQVKDFYGVKENEIAKIKAAKATGDKMTPVEPKADPHATMEATLQSNQAAKLLRAYKAATFRDKTLDQHIESLYDQTPVGKAVLSAHEGGGLDRELFESEYGKELADKIAETHKGFFKKDGRMALSEVAPEGKADEFLTTLVNSPSKKEAIEAMTKEWQSNTERELLMGANAGGLTPEKRAQLEEAGMGDKVIDRGRFSPDSGKTFIEKADELAKGKHFEGETNEQRDAIEKYIIAEQHMRREALRKIREKLAAGEQKLNAMMAKKEAEEKTGQGQTNQEDNGKGSNKPPKSPRFDEADSQGDQENWRDEYNRMSAEAKEEIGKLQAGSITPKSYIRQAGKEANNFKYVARKLKDGLSPQKTLALQNELYAIRQRQIKQLLLAKEAVNFRNEYDAFDRSMKTNPLRSRLKALDFYNKNTYLQLVTNTGELAERAKTKEGAKSKIGGVDERGVGTPTTFEDVKGQERNPDWRKQKVAQIRAWDQVDPDFTKQTGNGLEAFLNDGVDKGLFAMIPKNFYEEREGGFKEMTANGLLTLKEVLKRIETNGREGLENKIKGLEMTADELAAEGVKGLSKMIDWNINNRTKIGNQIALMNRKNGAYMIMPLQRGALIDGNINGQGPVTRFTAEGNTQFSKYDVLKSQTVHELLTGITRREYDELLAKEGKAEANRIAGEKFNRAQKMITRINTQMGGELFDLDKIGVTLDKADENGNNYGKRFIDYGETGGKFNVKMLRSVILHTGTEDNYAKMKLGYGLTDEDVQKIAGVFTKEELKDIQRDRETVERLYPEIKDVTMRRKEVSPAKLKAMEMTFHAKDGDVTLPGGYAPIYYNHRLLAQAEGRSVDQAAINVEQGKDSARNMTYSSDVKFGGVYQRVERKKVYMPIELEYESSLLKHIDAATRYTHLQEWLDKADRFVNNPDFKKAMIQKMGPEHYQATRNWVADIADPHRRDIKDDAVLEKLTNFSKASSLALKPENLGSWFISNTTALTQIGRGNPMEGIRHITEAMQMMGGYKGAEDLMKDYKGMNPTMKEGYIKTMCSISSRAQARYEHSKAQLDAAALRFMEGKGNMALNYGNWLSTVGVELTDMACSTPIWWGGYHARMEELNRESKTQGHKNFGMSLEEQVRQAGMEGDRVVELTQPVNSVAVASEFMKDKGNLLAKIPLFPTYISLAAGRLHSELMAEHRGLNDPENGGGNKIMGLSPRYLSHLILDVMAEPMMQVLYRSLIYGGAANLPMALLMAPISNISDAAGPAGVAVGRFLEESAGSSKTAGKGPGYSSFHDWAENAFMPGAIAKPITITDGVIRNIARKMEGKPIDEGKVLTNLADGAQMAISLATGQTLPIGNAARMIRGTAVLGQRMTGQPNP